MTVRVVEKIPKTKDEIHHARAHKAREMKSPPEVMTMQSNNKNDSLTDNLWAEMSLMMVLVVIVLALAWRYVW
jgi:hypothetical protein